jgi:glutaminyl-tRNA synthetase
MKKTMSGKPTANFIRHIIHNDMTNGKIPNGIVTRFPPEPNGFLHIGHAKSMCLNFGLPSEFSGHCNLRFDDTNPEKENKEYVAAIKEDVSWLGFNPEDKCFHASDYFEQLYDFAIELISKGKAYVDSQSAEEIRLSRGTLTKAGIASPFRERTVKENLFLFEQMRDGKLPEESHILRALIDMNSPNMNMRDPTIYRIRQSVHHRTGNKWCIYPMYDFTHCISDALEGVTHSLCTLEFEDHRPLYEWFLKNITINVIPKQIEFARLDLSYTLTSKRKLLELVDGNHVKGWADPRLPTLKGMRKRGYPPKAIKDFCERIGITKKQATIDMAVLENCVREELDRTARRAMAVLRPVKVILENFPEGKIEWIEIPNHPKDISLGKRKIPLTRTLYIEHDDFMEDPPKKFYRLSVGSEVRLRYGYVISCKEAIKDERGNVTKLLCTYDPDTGGGKTSDGRRIKGIIHWVSASQGIPVIVNLLDRLFNTEEPWSSENFIQHINEKSLEVCTTAIAEPSLAQSLTSDVFQFERLGYFCREEIKLKGEIIFNRTMSLRDTWAKMSKS